MFRSIRAARAKSRQTRANARKLFLESLEHRRLLAVSPTAGFATASLLTTGTPAAIYGPVQGGGPGLAAINLQPEGEGESLPSPSAARQLLFAGIAGLTPNATNSGLLTIIDSPTDSIVPWNAPLVAGGISGLAFDLTGRLFAAVDQGPCTTSELVELNPTNGEVIRRLPIMAGSTEINIGDLAIDPTTGRLFGARSIRDDANHAGELFVIDVDSGVATLIGDTGAGTGEGLAFASDGVLYLAGTDGGKPVLYKIDPDTAEPHQRDAVTGRAIPFVVLNDPTGQLKGVEGLAGHPDNGTLVATTGMTRFAGNQIVDDTYTIDPDTGTGTAQPLASPARGIFGDLAFQPRPSALDIVYQESVENGPGGFLADNTGGTLPGLWHYSLGRRFDSLPSHTPISSFYYGAFETAFGGGHYVLPLDHQGTLTSPPIQLPTSSVLSFNYLLDTRAELDVDFVDVSVITADGNITQILSRADGTLPQTGSQRWRTATADLSAFACQSIQLQFSFDTGPVPQVDPEGWYLDDLLIASSGGFCDLGDAPDDPTTPDDYPTLLTSDAARHGILEGFHLGSAIDAELDGQPTPMADGDDNNPDVGPNDEDGVTFMTLVAGVQGSVQVELTNTTGQDAFLDAWIDYNRDGDWEDVGEQVLTARAISAGTTSLDIAVPQEAQSGDTIARFRLSSTGSLRVTGYAPDGEVEDHKLSIEEADPRVVIVKTGAFNDANGDSFASAGETIDYAFDVSNDGNVPLSNVVISDTMVADITLDVGDTNMNGLLDVDETWMYSGSYTLTQADIDAEEKENTALVSATDPQGDPVSEDDTITTLLPAGNPSISVIKTGTFNDENGNAFADVGEKIRYTFEVKNDGNQTLGNVVISDAIVTNFALEGGDTNVNGLLDVDETWVYSGSYTLTQTDIDAGERANTATASATDPQGSPVNDDDTVTTVLTTVQSIEIVKTGSWHDANSNGQPDVEDTIEYEFKVTNTGNVTLLNVMVTDPMLTVGTLIGLTDADEDGLQDDLRPGEVAMATGSYALQQQDVDARMKVNTASADATGPNGDPAHDDDTATVRLPSIEIIKTNTSPGGWNDSNGNGRPDPGESIDYEFTITNDGKLTLFDVILTDSIVTASPLSGGLTDEDGDATADDLLPGEMATATGSYTLTDADVDAGQRANTATVSATDPDGNPIGDDDTVTTDLVPFSSISGRVFNDVNGNAVRDSFEAGINFVTVQLFVDTNGNGVLDDGATLLERITIGDGDYAFSGLVPGLYIVDVAGPTLPTGFDLTTGNDPIAVTVDAGSDAVADFGYQGVVQFVTPLGAFRSDLPDNLVVPFVRPASDPIGDLLRDPSRSLGTILPSYRPYQSVTVKNTSDSILEITELNTVIGSASIATDHFITFYTQPQLERLAEIELELDNAFAAEQPIPPAIRDELSQLLRGVTDPANQIPPVAAGDSIQLLLVYRPIQVGLDAEGIEIVTAQLPDWAPDAPAEQGKAHTFARTDRVEIATSNGSTLQFQLAGGSTYDSDTFDHNGFVGVDDFDLVNAIILQQWPTNPGDPLWDPTTDANVRFPNSADGIVDSRYWPGILEQENPIAREDALGDYGVFNVEIGRNSRAPFLDLDDGADALGVDYATRVSASDLPLGTSIVATDARFANAPFLELDSLTVVITNALDGEDEQLEVKTDGTDIVVVENRLENGQRILVLSHATPPDIPETVDSYLTVLKTIRYSNQSQSPTRGVRIIEIQALGTNADFSFMTDGGAVSQSAGNVAISRLSV